MWVVAFFSGFVSMSGLSKRAGVGRGNNGVLVYNVRGKWKD